MDNASNDDENEKDAIDGQDSPKITFVGEDDDDEDEDEPPEEKKNIAEQH